MLAHEPFPGAGGSSLGQTTGELVQVSVRSADVDPLPAAVALGRAHDLDACILELAARRMNIVDLEERDGPIRLLAEELVVRVSGRHDLHLVPLGGGELNSRRFLEVDPQTEDVTEEADHRLIAIGPDPNPSNVPHFHPSPV